MHINDCEVSMREVRGQRLAVIVGPRKVTAAEGSALLAQFFGTHTGRDPIYVSPDGWQYLEPAPVIETEPAAESAEQTGDDKPAAAPAKPKKK